MNYYTMLQYQLGVIGYMEMRSEKEISKKVRAHIVHAEVPPNCQERIDATNWTILQAPFRMYSCVPESRFPAIPAKFSEFGIKKAPAQRAIRRIRRFVPNSLEKVRCLNKDNH